MQVDQSAVVTIVIFLAAQTGALIFYAGVMLTKVNSHDKALDIHSTDIKTLAMTVAQLAAKGGIQL